MSKVRDFINRYYAAYRSGYGMYYSSDFEPGKANIDVFFKTTKKKVKGITFYLQEEGHKTEFTIQKRGAYVFFQPSRLDIYVRQKIDLENISGEYCEINFDLFSDDLHTDYNIPDFVDFTYSRGRQFWQGISDITIMNICDGWSSEWESSPECFKVSVNKLEKLFENSDNLEKDIEEYIRDNIVKPTTEYFQNLIEHIFNCGILDEIVDIIQGRLKTSSLDLTEMLRKYGFR